MTPGRKYPRTGNVIVKAYFTWQDTPCKLEVLKTPLLKTPPLCKLPLLATLLLFYAVFLQNIAEFTMPINTAQYHHHKGNYFHFFLVQQFITRCSIVVHGRPSTTSSLQFLPQETETLLIGRETLLVITEIKEKSK